MSSIKQIICATIITFLIVAKIHTADATMCEPLSRFKVDCNTCYCSVDGRHYTCTKRFCNSDVDLNFNGFLLGEPQETRKALNDGGDEEWNQYLNDLAVNYNNQESNEWNEEETGSDLNKLGFNDNVKNRNSRRRDWRF